MGQAQSNGLSFRLPMLLCAAVSSSCSLTACARKPDPNTLVMIIESSPTNLDPRVGIDAQSERIDELIFDSLVRRDEHFKLKPWLAESWEIPDPQTYVFHLRNGVRFHDGQPLTSRDVKWTLDSLLTGKIRSSKAATYNKIDHIDAPDDYTVIFHLKEPMASLLWNLSDGAIGIVPYGSGEEFNQQSHRLRPLPLRQRTAGQGSRDRAQPGLLGRRPPNCSEWNSKSFPTPPPARWSCASTAPMSPSTRSPPTPFVALRKRSWTSPSCRRPEPSTPTSR